MDMMKKSKHKQTKAHETYMTGNTEKEATCPLFPNNVSVCKMDLRRVYVDISAAIQFQHLCSVSNGMVKTKSCTVLLL